MVTPIHTSSPHLLGSAASGDPAGDINRLIHEIAYFLVPGADIAGNAARIKTLLASIDTSGFTALQKQYFSDAQSSLLDDIGLNDYSPASILRVYTEFYSIIGLPDATADSHMQGYINAANIFLGALLIQGKMNAVDMNGNSVAIGTLSNYDTSLLYQSMFVSYQHLEYELPNQKGDFSDSDYSAIMAWLTNQDFTTAMTHVFQGNPSTSDISDLVNLTGPILLHFDTPTPAASTQSQKSLSAPNAVSEAAAPNPYSQILNLEQYLFGFLLPGMDDEKNIARINSLISSIDPSQFSSDMERSYYNDAIAKIADMMKGQDFSAGMILQINNELGVIFGVPNSPNTASHFQGWIDAGNLYLGSELLQGIVYGQYLNGNEIDVTNLSPLDKSSLYLLMANSFQNLVNYIPAHESDFDSNTYNEIQTQLLQNSKLINDANILEQCALSGTDPDPSVIQEIGNIVFLVMGYFNTTPPSKMVF